MKKLKTKASDWLASGLFLGAIALWTVVGWFAGNLAGYKQAHEECEKDLQDLVNSGIINPDGAAMQNCVKEKGNAKTF